MAHCAQAFPMKRIRMTLGDIRIKVGIEMHEIHPAPVTEVNDEGPLVFRLESGDPGPVHTPNERPPSIAQETKGQPQCEINVINNFQQYRPPMRFPGVLNPVQCGDCDSCPDNTTWAPVYVKMPVLTAMFEANDTLTDRCYVMDIVTVPVTCSCQMMG